MVVQLLVQQGRHEIVRLLLDCMRSHLLLLVVMLFLYLRDTVILLVKKNRLIRSHFNTRIYE